MAWRWYSLMVLLCGCCGLTRETRAQDRFSLSGEWAFRTDVYNVGKEEGWFRSDWNVRKWDTLQVPGNWNTRLEYSDYTGVAWLRKTFYFPDSLPDGHLKLCFEAVYNDAQVWLNGEKLGEHDFGFTAFAFDVTDRLKCGKENVIVVRVDNSFKLGATWNWGGIRRPVWIECLPGVYPENMQITAVPDLVRRKASVNVRMVMKGEMQGEQLELKISDPQGRPVVYTKVRVKDTVLIPLTINKPQLWHFDRPVLYTASLSLKRKGKEIYRLEDRFGIRKIEVKGYRLLLNGENIRLMGANYVPYDRFHGNVLPSEIYRRDIDRMKSMGVNMARLSHLALPKEILDYLDEKGMLIFEEIPLWNKSPLVNADSLKPQRWLRELINERYNHPCIIGWSAGNEIGRLSDNPGLEGYLKKAFGLIRQLDSNRLAVYVTHTAAKQDNEPILLSDMILFNQYGAHGERAETVHRNYPGKPIFYSEYGTKVNGEDLDSSVDYSRMLEDMRGKEYLIGASVWTFNDYRSNYREGTETTQNRAWGVVDVYGRKKRGYAVLQREYSPLKCFRLQTGKKPGEGQLSLFPRRPDDLPAFRMQGYRVEMSARDEEGRLLATRSFRLPTVSPGEDTLRLRFDLEVRKIAKLEVALVSPVGYRIHELEHYYRKPAVPLISRAESSQSQIRVYFGPTALAKEWKLICEEGDKSWETQPTVDHYIQLEKLEYGKTYRLRLVAINEVGETEATDVLRVATCESELPPVVCHLQLNDRWIEIGYTSEPGDFAYEFEYGLSPDRLTRKMLVTETGACQLPVVEKGKDHYLRIRKRIRYGFAGTWSQVYKINAHSITDFR